MNVIEFTLGVGVVSACTALLGQVIGLDEGLLLVPVQVLGFGVDFRYAIGASLIAVLATSSVAAATHDHRDNAGTPLELLFELAAVVGALSGALMIASVQPRVFAMAFGAIILWSLRRTDHAGRLDALANRTAGFGSAWLAGCRTGLFGVGLRLVRSRSAEPTLERRAGLSTTTIDAATSVAAATGAGLYLHRGYIDPALALPVLIGCLFGSMHGARMRGGVARLVRSIAGMI